MFAQRLDLAMEVTNTSAAALGRAVSLDPSHVSRLRNGARALPRNPEFLPAMAAHIGSRVNSEYQRGALARATGVPEWPSDADEAAALIEHWLSGATQRRDVVSSIFERLSSPQTPSPLEADEPGQAALPPMKSHYYGDAGKQEAVLQFFTLILERPRPQTLLLLSEESMGWLYEDPAFTARWAALFRRVLEAGNRVRIVHSLKRDLTELFEAVAKWLPIYMTGAIEPYYLPRLRDGICRRTLFIAPETCAVSSFSIGDDTDGMLNELFTDAESIVALVREYGNYFALCKPLMRISTQDDIRGLWESLEGLLPADGDVFCMAGSPTLATMPEDVVASMQRRSQAAPLATWADSAGALLERLGAATRMTVVIPQHVKRARGGPRLQTPELSCAGYLGCAGLRYEPGELAAHELAIERLASENAGISIVRTSKVPQNLLVVAREGAGTVIVKTDAPCVAFAFSEPTITNAFREYLSAIAGV